MSNFLGSLQLTQAEGFILGVGAKMFSCCGARHIPCRRSGFVICRPLPLAQVASSATGGAPIAPHRRTGDCVRCFRIDDVWTNLLDNHIILTVGRGLASASNDFRDCLASVRVVTKSMRRFNLRLVSNCVTIFVSEVMRLVR